ncbi:MAG TPA: bifunctional methylenetetrahydrofolate dehydrogenase/methenyltetrahydrofolate cyclohydrolase FolD [Myxococcota bacterium]|jgi:methylenetetrahydrofolate dehydrogenase (NADP+)/methenyltetrahydrofolate cyclohydrolase|nr:bifunctional methylenetetrahydrofolate dehydrogenase/methenyltetrahydrofolate cyclohydrolase FolD [Myxococcota bacterium]
MTSGSPPSSPAPQIATHVVDGMALAQELRAEIAADVAKLVSQGRRPPCLAVVLVGDDPASLSYIKGKRRACERAGIASREHDLPATATQEDVIDVVSTLNRDPQVDGILVQLPLPKPLDATAVTEAVDPAKDVDGLHTVNAGRLLAGLPGLRPCTPLGILEVLDRRRVPLVGAHAVVIGRSALVGKPVALLLLERHATVTICHSRTRDLASVVRSADVVVAAAGSAELVKGDWIRPGAAVIDIGVNVVDGVQRGDVDFDAALGRAALITPSRGGVGPLTITMLLRNTLSAYRARVVGERLG